MLRRIKKLLLRRDTIRALTETERATVKAGQAMTCPYVTREVSGCVTNQQPKPPK
jgi:hypothetical protein